MGRLWFKVSAAFAVGAALSSIYLRPGVVGSALIVVFAWLAGAALGALADWLRHGRSPLDPVFPARFGWFYARGYWQRFALVFAGSWLGFVAVAAAVALLAGEYGEAAAFVSARGALAVLIFVAVFAVEGAVMGLILDLLLHFHGRGRG